MPGTFMTVGEVSEYLRVHPSTIYRLLRRKQIPAFRIGSDWRFKTTSIDQWQADLERAQSENRRA